VLGACPRLDTVAFKSNRITTLEPMHLPARLRWLMLTNNQIREIPASFGRFDRLRKLALAGNQISAVPDDMAGCRALELVRVSSNRLTKPPEVLFDLPRLAWISFSGNDFWEHAPLDLPVIPRFEVQHGDLISQGASGQLFGAQYHDRDVALKVFSGAVTSDGAALDEIRLHARCEDHPNIIGLKGRVEGDGLSLVMDLVPPSYTPLGLPPTLETCTRDTFASGVRFDAGDVIWIGHEVARGLEHLLQHDVAHGDLYAHNVLFDAAVRHAYVCDFGAASDLRGMSTALKERVKAIEVCALGRMLEDLIGVSGGVSTELKALTAACTSEDVFGRPAVKDVVAALGSL
jgi:serine/threonine protein kinase